MKCSTTFQLLFFEFWEASAAIAALHIPSLCCRYKDGPTKEEFPMFESLKLTIERTLPYWNDVIVPQVRANTFCIKLDIGGNMWKGADEIPTSYPRY